MFHHLCQPLPATCSSMRLHVRKQVRGAHTTVLDIANCDSSTSKPLQPSCLRHHQWVSSVPLLIPRSVPPPGGYRGAVVNGRSHTLWLSSSRFLYGISRSVRAYLAQGVNVISPAPVETTEHDHRIYLQAIDYPIMQHSCP